MSNNVLMFAVLVVVAASLGWMYWVDVQVLRKAEMYDVRDLIMGLRGVPRETSDKWLPDEGSSWSCLYCDWWTPDTPPPDVCPRCGSKEATDD